MLKILWLQPKDMQRWDDFVYNHPYGWICHLSAWQQVLEKTFSHIKGTFLAVIDDVSGDIVAGLPLYTVKSWLTGTRLVSIPFATICDPLISSTEHIDYLLSEVINFLGKSNASYYELRTQFLGHLLKSTMLGCSSGYKNHYLPLEDGPEELLRTFHPTQVRRNIKKAIKFGLSVRTAKTTEDIMIFYQLYVKTRKLLGLPPMIFNFFMAMWNSFSHSGKVIFLIAELDSTAVAAAMLFKFKNRLSLDYLGWDRQYKHCSPSVYIYWQAIKMAYEEGCTIFDFGRTSIYNRTLLHFKSHWATREMDLPEYYYPSIFSKKESNKEAAMSYKIVKSICSRTPEVIFKMIGNICYRHMG